VSEGAVGSGGRCGSRCTVDAVALVAVVYLYLRERGGGGGRVTGFPPHFLFSARCCKISSYGHILILIHIFFLVPH